MNKPSSPTSTTSTTPTERALAHLEDFLSRAQPGFESDKRMHREAEQLSLAYTEGGTVSPDAAASLAYLAHFGPRAILAVAHAAGAYRHGRSASVAAAAPLAGVVHALDFGAGSGASALALLQLGVKRVTLLERSGKALTQARELLASFRDRCVFTQGARDLGDVDLLASSFTFGELETDPVAAFASLSALTPQATRFLLVDAGDHARSRRLQQVRDSVASTASTASTAATASTASTASTAFASGPRAVTTPAPSSLVRAWGTLRIVGPCPHHDPCPALVRERDWCHDRIKKILPKKLARFAEGVGRDSDWMALSWLALSDARLLQEREDALVVIGAPLVEKGRVRLPVCGPSGVRFLAGLKRDRAAYQALRDFDRGARLPLAVVTTGERNASGETVRIELAPDVPVDST